MNMPATTMGPKEMKAVGFATEALLEQRPEPTPAELARVAGCARQSLYKMKTLRKVRRLFKIDRLLAKERIRTGFLRFDDNGNYDGVEAIAGSEQS